jgi:DNA polymerase I-like protein with 3'-5' exonuclease and polymerase domains
MYKLLLNGMCEQYPTLVTVTNAVLGTTLSVKDKKEKQKEDWGGELTPEQLDYAAGDTLYLHEVFKRLKAELQKDSKLWGVYTGIEIPCLYSTADMEFRGVPTDVEVFEQLAEITVPKQLAVKEELLEIFSSVGRKDVNLNSWQQLLPAFNDLGSPIPNTQATTLEECDHPAAVKLLEYKAYKKTLEFVVSLPKFLSPSTERVHGNFNGQGTETGRFSASKPK